MPEKENKAEKLRPMPRRDFLAGTSALALAVHAELKAAAACAVPGQSSAVPAADPYTHYIRSSRDFKRVKQDRAWSDKAFPGWIYMPWTYQWNIGYTDASGHWSQTSGINGAFLDGNGGAPDSPAGKLAWINRFHLRFYLDHTAGKGSLHLWDVGKQKPYLV